MSQVRMSPAAPDTPMIQKQAGQLTYEICPVTHGMYFDFGELKTALDMTKAENFSTQVIQRGDDQSDHAHHYLCPDSGVEMEEREYAYDSGIHIDYSPVTRGIFVSQQDLKEIKRFLHTSKHSDQGKQAAARAHKVMDEIFTETVAKMEATAAEIDNQFWIDDLPGINLVTEWLIGESVDLDAFHRTNR